ncbi:hypothetical protein J2T20_003743 [Paenibacillus wynnii]|nr:hypothetical protein [Paenibacillus wynnii]
MSGLLVKTSVKIDNLIERMTSIFSDILNITDLLFIFT